MRLFSLSLFGMAICLFSGCEPLSQEVPVAGLIVERVLPIDSDIYVEPSGLVWHGGVLYSVSDKSDDTIFRITLGENSARYVPHLKFRHPQGHAGPLDLEGITVGRDGNFYLASEYTSRVLVVNAEGRSHWLTPDLRPAGEPEGLLRKYNAGLEDIALLPDGDLLLAAERESRGLIHISSQNPEKGITARQHNHSRYGSALPFWRLPDFAGLSADGGKVFALYRNAHLVVEMVPDEDYLFTESTRAWSYAAVENDERWAYTEERFGQAEGLAVNGQRVYIVVDNNGSARKANAQDKRPLLYVLRFPE